MTTKRRRADLDDEEMPAFVTEASRPVPRCCRCGRDVITARSLWTLCEECIRHSLELPATPIPKHPQGTHAMIVELAKRMCATLSKRADEHGNAIPAAVQWHVERLVNRGLDEASARRLSEAMATDPTHRAGCERCRADTGAIESNLLQPQEDTVRLYEIGREFIPKRSKTTRTRVA